MDVAKRSNRAKYECLLFDVDGTLYPLSSRLSSAMRKSIQDFMQQCLHMEESEVQRMHVELPKKYGTTLEGLKALGYEFNNEEFFAYVYGRLPYEILKPDLILRNLLLSMPQRKIVFTNGAKAHAVEVLNRLGLEDCFEGIICFETLNPPIESDDTWDLLDEDNFFTERHLKGNSDTDVNTFTSKSRILCKPSVEAIEAAIKIANADLSKTIFFDDDAQNIAHGKVTGLHTVIVGSSMLVSGADYALRSIHNIKEAIPEIWEEAEEHLKCCCHLT